MSKLLLHTCCAPCTTYVFQSLTDQGFAVSGYFYNPNIQPQTEFNLRQETMKKYAAIVGLEVIYDTPSVLTSFGHLPLTKGENERGLEPKNCASCYRVRLLKTAKSASELGFECFSTTLLISPFQKIELIKKIGDEIAGQIGVKFLSSDFRPGYKESRRLARELNLYMQRYCGCQN